MYIYICASLSVLIKQENYIGMLSLSKGTAASSSDQDDSELRRGPWTIEEDTLLVDCVSRHGEGRWNLLAKKAGLKRSGKSCRLRWLNYLKPDVKRGNLTPQEQLLILELHSKWGNRWSRIAQHLPGRTDNEIKNYWRTRVQKQARHLNIDANSTAFQEVIRLSWMPRLAQKTEGSSPSENPPPINNYIPQASCLLRASPPEQEPAAQGTSAISDVMPRLDLQENKSDFGNYRASMDVSEMSHLSHYQTGPFPGNYIDGSLLAKDCCHVDAANLAAFSATGDFVAPITDCHVAESYWVDQDMCDGLWTNNAEEHWGLGLYQRAA